MIRRKFIQKTALTAAGLLIPGLFVPNRAEAAIAEVGSGSQRASSISPGSVASQVATFPANVASGNLIIAAGTAFNAGGLSSVTVTDNRGAFSAPQTLTFAIDGSAMFLFLAYGITTS